MKFMLSLLAFGYVALASAAPSLPVHPGGIGGLFIGPNSETIIKGPDGSVITAAANGGEVNSQLETIIVAEPAAVEIAPAPVVEAVAIGNQQSSDLIGPSGRISTHGSQSVVAGPASTTVTGPGILAETVVRGPSIVGTPIVNAISAFPVSVTPSSIATLTAEIAPISITASPIATVTSLPVSATAAPGLLSVTGAAFPSVTGSALNRALVSTGTPSSLSTLSVGSPPLVATAAAPQAVATASVSPHFSVASASATNGASAIASAAPNIATAAIDTTGISTVAATSLPSISSTLGPVQLDGIQGLGIGINDRIDFTSQLIQDQIAVDNRQLNLNLGARPALPAYNILSPEIAVTPRIPVGRLGPTPGTLLTTPGLGAVASSTNIQREEGDITLNATPNTLQGSPLGLRPQDILAIQNRNNLLNNQIQHAQQAAGPEAAAAITPNTLQINPQVSLTQEQVAAIQNQQILLNNQIQQAAGAGLASADQTNGKSLTSNTQASLASIQQGQASLASIQQSQASLASIQQGQASLANIQQQNLLTAELAKAGIDPAQVQLTNIPLTAVSAIPGGIVDGRLKATAINDGLVAEAWGRYGRDVEKEKKGGKKASKNN